MHAKKRVRIDESRNPKRLTKEEKKKMEEKKIKEEKIIKRNKDIQIKRDLKDFFEYFNPRIDGVDSLSFVCEQYAHPVNIYDEVKIKNLIKRYSPASRREKPEVISVIEKLKRMREYKIASLKASPSDFSIQEEMFAKIIYFPTSKVNLVSSVYVRDNRLPSHIDEMPEEIVSELIEEEISFLDGGSVAKCMSSGMYEILRQITQNLSIKDNITEQYESYKIEKLSTKQKPSTLEDWLKGEVRSYFLKASQEKVKEVGWHVEKEKAIQYLSPTALTYYATMESSPWDEILNRISNKEEFLAWLWIMFRGGKASSQALWVYGTGNDGKSTIANVLGEILNGVSCVIPQTLNQFSASKLHNKRLAINSDVRGDLAMDDRFIFQLTGGDSIDVEKKGADSFKDIVNCMLFCTSNTFPKIDVYMPAHVRRVLISHISPIPNVDRSSFSDEEFKHNLYLDRYYLIARAKEAHDRLALEAGVKELINVPLDEHSKKYIHNNCKTRYTLMAERFLESGRIKIAGYDNTVSVTDLQRRFHEFLERKGIVVKNSPIGIGSDNLKNFLIAKGARDEGAEIRFVAFEGEETTPEEVVTNEVENIF